MKETEKRPKLVFSEGLRYWTIPLFEQMGYRTAFFTRYGGVSTGACKGLNLGMNTEDELPHVHKNREAAFRIGDFGPYFPVVGNQVHGKRIRLVNHRDAGKGWTSISTAIKKNDGLVTTTGGLPLAVSVADCLPVLLVAEKKQAVAAVHAGWRGITQGILIEVIKQFRKVLAIGPEQLWIAIGPGIGPQKFRVKGLARTQLTQVSPNSIRKDLDGSATCDLWIAATTQLIQHGIRKEQIITIRECTASHPKKYFSYRRDNNTGRMLGMVQIIK
jgi:purine-nucleoside/S-methyl-5'-thioadenosine phosphorylase / adenosine deaminase